MAAPTSTPREKIDWNESGNLGLYGSDLEQKIQQAAAAEGPLSFAAVGHVEGIHVGRIERYTVQPWTQLGKFHKGDSYVILHTHTVQQHVRHDIYIWIGNESTEDEYGTAAYKMIELDEKLGGTAVQHRETQERESTQFLSLFNNKITYLEGGVTSGFTYVEPSTLTEPHLFQIKGTKKANTLRLTQVPVQRHSLNHGDVFVLAAGEANVWLWIGKESNVDEQAKGREMAAAYCSKGTPTILQQGVNDGEAQAVSFWAYLPSKVSVLGLYKRTVHMKEADERDDKGHAFVPALFRMPDKADGDLTRVARARATPVGPTGTPQILIPRSKLQSKHAYLLDTGFHLYIWTGSLFSASGKAHSVPAAHQYLIDYDRPLLPITILKEHQEVPGFEQVFHDKPGGCACTIS